MVKWLVPTTTSSALTPARRQARASPWLCRSNAPLAGPPTAAAKERCFGGGGQNIGTGRVRRFGAEPQRLVQAGGEQRRQIEDAADGIAGSHQVRWHAGNSAPVAGQH